MNSDGIPRFTVQDRVRFMWVFDAYKHQLNAKGQSVEAYADQHINQMTQAEFLESLSEAIEERLKSVPPVSYLKKEKS